MVGPSRAAGFGTLSRRAHYKPGEGFRGSLERAAVDHDRLKREAVEAGVRGCTGKLLGVDS